MADEAFGVTLRADFAQFEKALLKAQNQTDAKLNAIENKFTRSQRTVKAEAAAMGGVFSDLRTFASGAASELPVLGAGMGSVGIVAGGAAIGVAALVASLRGVEESSKWAADLTDAAERIGVTAEALQELRYVADETGVPLDQLDKSIEALNGTLGAFKTGIGAGRVTPVFEAMGLTQADLASVENARDLLPILADRLGQVQDRAEQVQLARKLGIEPLLPLLRQGSEGIRSLADEGRDLGLVLSNDVVKGLDETDRALEKNRQQIHANVTSLKASLAPFWIWVTQQAANAARAINRVVQQRYGIGDDRRPLEQLQRDQDAYARRVAEDRAKNGGRLSGNGQNLQRWLNRTTQEILRRRQGEAPAPSAANGGFELNLPPPSAPTVRAPRSGGGGTMRADNSVANEARQELSRDRRFADQLSDAQESALRAQSALATTAQQRASIAIMLLDSDRQQRRIELDRMVADGDLTQARREQLEAAERGVWIAREANISAALDQEELATARDQLKEALARDAAANEAARRVAQDARDNFKYEFVDGMRSALDGEIGGYFEDLADRFSRRLLGNLADDLYSLFSETMKGQKGGIGGFLSSALKSIPGFAAGTNSAPGGLAYVHQGEVLANLQKGTSVIPAHAVRTMGLLSGGGPKLQAVGAPSGGPVQISISLSGANGDAAVAAIAEAAARRGTEAAIAQSRLDQAEATAARRYRLK